MHTITRSNLEEDVKDNLRELCNKYSAKYDHNPASIYGTTPGRSDYTVLNKNGVTLYIECKRLGYPLKKPQEIYKNEIELRYGIFILYDGSNDDELCYYLDLKISKPILFRKI